MGHYRNANRFLPHIELVPVTLLQLARQREVRLGKKGTRFLRHLLVMLMFAPRLRLRRLSTGRARNKPAGVRRKQPWSTSFSIRVHPGADSGEGTLVALCTVANNEDEEEEEDVDGSSDWWG
jgi:hypothetical protein